MLLTPLENRILRVKGKALLFQRDSKHPTGCSQGKQIPVPKSLLEGIYGGEGVGTVTAAEKLCPCRELQP